MRLTPAWVADQHEQHFSVVDLVARPAERLPDHLRALPGEARVDFLCALLYTTLIDQVMYAHRRVNYEGFRSLTLSPKMDRTVGYARTLMMANPFELLGDEILESRGLNREDVQTRFAEWAEFLVRDMRGFFTKHQIGSTTWPQVRSAILADPGATLGSAGLLLAQVLEEDRRAI